MQFSLTVCIRRGNPASAARSTAARPRREPSRRARLSGGAPSASPPACAVPPARQGDLRPQDIPRPPAVKLATAAVPRPGAPSGQRGTERQRWHGDCGPSVRCLRPRLASPRGGCHLTLSAMPVTKPGRAQGDPLTATEGRPYRPTWLRFRRPFRASRRRGPRLPPVIASHCPCNCRSPARRRRGRRGGHGAGPTRAEHAEHAERFLCELAAGRESMTGLPGDRPTR